MNQKAVLIEQVSLKMRGKIHVVNFSVVFEIKKIINGLPLGPPVNLETLRKQVRNYYIS